MAYSRSCNPDCAAYVRSSVIRALAILLLATLSLAAQIRSNRFALILQDKPVAEEATSRKDIRNSAAAARLQIIETAQGVVRHELERRGMRITGSTQYLLNAVFVAAPESRVNELRNLPGVIDVYPMRPIKRHLSRAVDLIRAREAWGVAGGEANAGSGVKIGVLDSGIDHTHPGFQQSLPAVSGFQKCRPEDCAYTNSKVIAARSYVEGLVLGDNPVDSRPDDLTPRDRSGHGTAIAMIAAGARNDGPAGSIVGVAPAAYLGNYKIFGSPGVNDVTFDDVLVQALEDAFVDGMDIVTLSLGTPALWGPQDAGSVCGLNPGEACDYRADAVNRAVRSGMLVVASAGNDGDLGIEVPALNSLHSPGTAPAALTVGATTNAHQLYHSVRVPDGPGNLQRINALFGDGPKPAERLTAPMRDVSKLDDPGTACEPLTNGSLDGSIALIQRGDCALEFMPR